MPSPSQITTIINATKHRSREKGAAYEKGLLLRAIKAGNTKKITAIIANGAEDSSKRAGLDAAARLGNEYFVRLLLDAGASSQVLTPTPSGMSASTAHIAAACMRGY